jgi:UDP-GlcNAc:undecaprenyl-phosphate GlcNAc-1-phosphate transferase
MMVSLLLAFACTVTMMVVLTPLAYHFGLVAKPGEHRHHDRPTPLIGGIAVFLALVVTARFTNLEIPVSVWLAMCIVMFFGVIDDHWTVPFWIRFAVQITAAIIMVRDGIVLNDLGNLASDELFTLGRWASALTVFSIVGVINAINMIDGMDGLVGSILCITLGAIAYLSISGEGMHVATLSGVMVACLAGFLVFNLRISRDKPVKAFMGDAGTMLLGVFVSWILISETQGPAASFPPVIAIWILAIPLIDTVGVMVRRMIHGQSPFHADRTHTHHYLQNNGLGTNQALLVMILAALLFSIVGIAGIKSGIEEHVLFFTFLGIFTLYLVLIEIGFSRI